jgi:hypothetical protein
VQSLRAQQLRRRKPSRRSPQRPRSRRRKIKKVLNRDGERTIIGAGELQTLNKALQRLERFWTDQILYRL